MASNYNGLKPIPGVGITTGITDLLDEYKDAFEGLRHIPGEYHIVTDDAVSPLVHPPRPCTSGLGNQNKEKLSEMVASEIITPVTEPNRWVSSMFVVVKTKTLQGMLWPSRFEQSHLLGALPYTHDVESRHPTFTSKEVHRWFLAQTSWHGV